MNYIAENGLCIGGRELIGVPVNPMNDAFGSALRRCCAKPSINPYWLRCASSAMTMTVAARRKRRMHNFVVRLAETSRSWRRSPRRLRREQRTQFLDRFGVLHITDQRFDRDELVVQLVVDVRAIHLDNECRIFHPQIVPQNRDEDRPSKATCPIPACARSRQSSGSPPGRVARTLPPRRSGRRRTGDTSRPSCRSCR